MISFAQAQATKRLILKDGSYQTAVKYEIKGDRVHYLSAERYEWEDLPKDLIDWNATKKYEDDLKSGRVVSEGAKAEDAEALADLKAQEARSPQIAPGLRLPDTGGVFLFDTFQAQPQLVELNQTGSEINANRKTNILRATVNPIASAKQSIEIPGQHAKAQSHMTKPSIYVLVEDDPSAAFQLPEKGSGRAGAQQPQQPAQPEQAQSTLKPSDRYRIVKLEQKKDARVVGNMKVSMLGKVSKSEAFIPTAVDPMPGGWVKVSPAQDLAPGEYALVEMIDSSDINLYVWDFGVNPSAAANEGAWKPVEASNTKAADDTHPILQDRKKD